MPALSTMTKLLLVEDNAEIKEMLTSRLEVRGYEVVSASDGREALERAGAERPDAILMDLSLPVMDGWEAIGHLKAAAATRAIPVIALTAHAMSGDEAKAMAAGADGYETKPVDLNRLLAKVNQLVADAATSNGAV